MKNKVYLMALLCSMSLMAGCAMTQRAPVEPQRTSAVILAPKDKVWPLLVTEVGLNYPVQAIEKESGLLSTQFVNIPVGINNSGMQQYAYSPGGFLATWNGLRMNMRIVAVESEPGKTLITINAHYEAFENNVSNSWRIAQSNGAIENKILTSIEQKLAAN